jgi:hypothetical protein
MCVTRKGDEPQRSRRRNRSDAQIGFLFSSCGTIVSTKTPPMNLEAKVPGIRACADNPNHHLWNNHGTWFLHYTAYPTPFTKERIRRSLGTKDVLAARSRRDRCFEQLTREAAKLAPPPHKQAAA